MKNYSFSPSTLAFYDNFSKEAYVASSTWPDDVVEVSDTIFEKYSGTAPQGQVLGAKKNAPAWVNIPEPTAEEKKAAAEAVKISLLNEAKSAMLLPQTKLLLNRASDEEKETLNSWLDYVEAVDNVDISNPSWPEIPAS